MKKCPHNTRCEIQTHSLLNMSLLPLPLDQGSRPSPDLFRRSYLHAPFVCHNQVAIKTIKKSKIETEADLVRIRREIQIMSSVQHPNIIHIYEGQFKYFLNGPIPASILYFRLFYKQFTLKYLIKVADGWIRTLVLCQLCHNHCPI